MWHTPTGDRVLQGAEAALVKAAVAGVLAGIKQELGGEAQQTTYGIHIFDRLTASQRLALLEQVAVHLLIETPEPVALTAANEAAIAVLFQHLEDAIEREILDGGRQALHLRRLVLAACDALGDEDDEFPPPDVDCDDPEAWHECLDLLQAEVLWDLDYELEDAFLDVPPEAAEFHREFLGIDEDYYSAVAPDVLSAEEVERAVRRVERVVGDRVTG